MSQQYPELDGNGYPMDGGGGDPGYPAGNAPPQTGPTYSGGGTPVSPGSPAANPVGMETLNVDQNYPLPDATGYHLVRGSLVYYKRVPGPPPSVLAFYALGEGEWSHCVKMWYAGEEIAESPDATTPGWRFHPGTLSTGPTDPVQGVDPFLPDGLTYNKTAYVAVLLPERFSTEEEPGKLVGLYLCRKMADYDFDGTQLHAAIASVNPADRACDVIRAGYERRYADPAVALAKFQARVDWQTYWDWWQFAAPTITWHDGTTEHTIARFECHSVFTGEVQVDAALDAICVASCVRWQDTGEKIRFLLPTDTESRHTFRPDNVLEGSLSLGSIDVRNAPRHLAVKFRNVMDEHLEEMTVHRKRPLLIRAYREHVTDRVYMNMNPSQAMRVMEYQFALETDNRELLTLVGFGDSLHLLVGDFVTVAMGVITIDGDYMVAAAVDDSPESTPDHRPFTLQRIRTPLYSDTNHGPLETGVDP